jgi:hypothetical protein
LLATIATGSFLTEETLLAPLDNLATLGNLDLTPALDLGINSIV